MRCQFRNLRDPANRTAADVQNDMFVSTKSNRVHRKRRRLQTTSLPNRSLLPAGMQSTLEQKLTQRQTIYQILVLGKITISMLTMVGHC